MRLYGIELYAPRMHPAIHFRGNSMPRRSNDKLTEHTVKSAKPRANRYEIRDISKPGLMLRVTPAGSKYWYIEYERGVKRRLKNAQVWTLTKAWAETKREIGNYIPGKTLASRRKKTPTLKEHLEGEYRDYAETNLKAGKSQVKRLLSACRSLLKTRLDKLTEISVEKWKRERLKKVKPATVRRDLMALKSAINSALKWQIISSNPIANVQVKVAAEHRVRYLSQKERKRLLNALNDRDRKKRVARISANEWRRERRQDQLPVIKDYCDYLTPLILTVLNTGIRRSEALRLGWTGVRLTGNPALTVQAASAKSNKTRHIPLNSTLVNTLTTWKAQGTGEGPVFPHPVSGLPMSNVKTAWLQLMKDAKVEDFRFHDLRHDFASQLVMHGVDLYRVKELLGHGSIAMTERYAHLAPEALAEAVEVLA